MANKKNVSDGKRNASRPLGIVGALATLGLIVLLARSFWPADLFEGRKRGTADKPERASDLLSRVPFSELRTAQPQADVLFSDFRGASACQPCHAGIYAEWRASTHGRAGGPATEDNRLLVPFDGTPIRYKDATVIPEKKNGNYVFTIRRPGQPEQEIVANAAVGIGAMHGGGTQSFFSEHPDGTLRFLPFDYSAAEKKWFSQRRSDLHWISETRNLALSDLSEWPPNRILGTEEGRLNCQNCHGSQILVEFMPDSGRYNTRYQTLAVDCESCHGPGRKHIDWANSRNRQASADIGYAPLAALSKDASLNVCMQCHAVKDVLAENYLPGASLKHFYSLKLPMLGDSPYLPDGRVRAFAYQQNHFFSDCYINGSMTCVDCHAPHSQAYRDINARPLQGKFDDGQCTDCHPSKAADVQAHTHHPPDSPGSACTSCHMPFLQHRLLGDDVRFARSDHTIPIPRPAYDAKKGLQSACIICHNAETPAALQKQVEAWYGQLKPHKSLVRAMDNVRRNSSPDKAAALLEPAPGNPMMQYAALATFVREKLRPDMPGLPSEIEYRLKTLADSPDIDIKALALMALHLALGENEETREFLETSLAATGPDEATVRERWGRGLDYLGSSLNAAGRPGLARPYHEKALQINSEDAVAFLNLGNTYGAEGDHQRALLCFQEAVRLAPNDAAAISNQAIAYVFTGRSGAARELLREALDRLPYEVSLRLQLAQMYRQAGNHQAAKELLDKGLVLMPGEERFRD